MRLSELLADEYPAPPDIEVTGLALNSADVRPGYGFFALAGFKQDGLRYGGQALANGAAVVMYDPEASDPALIGEAANVHSSRVYLPLAGLAAKVGELAARFYGRPSEKMAVIGVTGTNGKSTCTHLLAQCLPDCGVAGTLGWGRLPDLTPLVNTTPDALTMQSILADFYARGLKIAAIEASSHGLAQGRLRGVRFAGAVFTNLSRDHLDYHASMDEYFRAKSLLFTQPDLPFAVINLDDAHGARLPGILPVGARCLTYSCAGARTAGAEAVCAEDARFTPEGAHFNAVWNGQAVPAFIPLLGEFNLQNALAALAVMLALGVELPEAAARLARARPCQGRMEMLGGGPQPLVIVDYAHTPDALAKTLRAIRHAGALTVVFGCGGDRDAGKRPLMGEIAESYADRVILTDDNPRSEAAENIIQDILAGCRSAQVMHDRALAIAEAIAAAAAGDVVLIAGKGHEQYQEIKGQKFPFSDQEAARRALAAWSEHHEIKI